MQPLIEKTGYDHTYPDGPGMQDERSGALGRWLGIIRRASRAFIGPFGARVLFNPVSFKLFVATGVLSLGVYLFQDDQIGGNAVASVVTSSGLTVDNLIVTGTNELDPVIVEEQLAPILGSSILGVDAELARSRVAAISWVKDATVKKAYPNTLVVDLVERRPVALWKSDGVLFLISPDGFVIDEAGLEHMHLPQVVGEGANEVASEFLSGIDQFDDIVSRADAYVRVASRRWDVLLDNGLRVLLPAEGWRDALLDLQKMHDEKQLLDREILKIDMRLADRVVLRLDEDAASERRSLFEEGPNQNGRAI